MKGEGDASYKRNAKPRSSSPMMDILAGDRLLVANVTIGHTIPGRTTQLAKKRWDTEPFRDAMLGMVAWMSGTVAQPARLARYLHGVRRGLDPWSWAGASARTFVVGMKRGEVRIGGPSPLCRYAPNLTRG